MDQYEQERLTDDNAYSEIAMHYMKHNIDIGFILCITKSRKHSSQEKCNTLADPS